MNLAMFQKQFANLRRGLRLLGGIFKARAGVSLTSVRSKGESQEESVACGAGFLHAAIYQSIGGPWEVNSPKPLSLGCAGVDNQRECAEASGPAFVAMMQSLPDANQW